MMLANQRDHRSVVLKRPQHSERGGQLTRCVRLVELIIRHRITDYFMTMFLEHTGFTLEYLIIAACGT